MKKILNVFIILLGLIALTACFSVNEVTNIEFVNAPAATYEKDAVVEASDFSVVISFQDGKTLTLKLNDSRLTVTGLDGDKLDTKTHGLKTINISYQGFSVSVSYNVEGQFFSYWSDEANRSNDKTLEQLASGITNAADLAQFAFLVNAGAVTTDLTFTLAPEGNFDLSAHEWVPIVGFKGKFDGQNQTISGLRITDGSGTKDYANKGFFASTSGTVSISNLTFDEVFINSVSDGLGEKNKNYAAVVGYAAGTISIANVTVQNSTIVGHGRVAAMVGQADAKVTITDSESIDNNFTAVNGYAAKSADGNGDKVGGLVGQAQSEILISECLVDGVTINGTRDLGGLIGFASAKTTLNKNDVKDTLIQASVPGGMLPTKGTRSIGVLVGTLYGSTTATDLVLGIGADKNTYSTVTMLANTLYEEITVTGVLFGGYRATANQLKKIVIGENTYQLKSIVSPNADNITDYADDIAVITSFLLDVYNGNTPSLPAPTELLELTQLP